MAKRSGEPKTKRGVGRPRSFDRDKALEAAMLLYWERGYEGVTISELTAAMGIMPASLYAAFGNKETLYSEALAYYQAHERPTWKPLAQASLRETLIALFEQGVRVVTRRGRPRGCMIASGFLDAASGNEHLAEEPRRLRAVLRRDLLERMEAAGAAGELAEDVDPKAAALFLAALLAGISVQAKDGVTARDLSRVTDIAVTALSA